MVSRFERLLLTLRRVLFGNTFPSLRATTIGVKNRVLTTIFYCDGEIDDDEFDMISSANAEFYTYYRSTYVGDERVEIKDYHDYYYVEDFEIKRYDYPKKLKNKKLDYWIYARAEKNLSALYEKGEKKIVLHDIVEGLDIYERVEIVMQKILLGLITSSVILIRFKFNKTQIIVNFIYDGKIGKEEEKISLMAKNRLENEIQGYDFVILNIRYYYDPIFLETIDRNSSYRVFYASPKLYLECQK